MTIVEQHVTIVEQHVTIVEQHCDYCRTCDIVHVTIERRNM